MDFAISLFFCALTWSSVPEVTSDAGDIVSIYSADAIPIRLRGGTTTSGRVEVYYNDQWGTICDDGFDIDDAKVICRQLGFTNVTGAYTQAHFGEGVDPIWLSNLACNGNEESLKDCQHSGWGPIANCKHEEDAGVECSGTPSAAELFQMLSEQTNAHMQQAAVLDAQQTTITTIQQELDQLAADVPTLVQTSALQNGEIGELQQLMGTLDYKVDELNNMAVFPIRLMGGNASHGRVEVWHDGQWGSICDDNWDINDAKVVCRQLGYEDAITAYSHAEYGEGTGPILMDSVACTGPEPQLAACAHEGWAVHDCKHEEDAGVGCLYQDEQGTWAAFSAGWTAGNTKPSGAYIIPFNSVYTNIGGHYSSSNGRFTAPISGHYFFVVNAHSQYLGSYDVYLDFLINNSPYKSNWIYDIDNHDHVDTSSNSIIIHLNKNDYVSIRIHSSSYALTGYEKTTFSGFLIQAD
ncbi:PREDICTED: deleted in malignant brain tumors 1 protein-like [Branchiostoma belcheri]|uniref:Deleted in malignant brain tumors 1 protein-like n=1 Tax=Branchiostoma belcheri TaxID=7741 RepID=A0A6P4Y186_BRABE|nr:PREDICTED: deleted in malignant brain tumors 1 protein-like [Branchiostoma belcheri]